MKNLSLAARFLIGAVVWLAILGIHFRLARSTTTNTIWSDDLLYAAMLFCACMGFVGLAELRRLGMRRLVRSIQACVMVLVLPVILIPGAFSSIPLIAAAAAMLGACIAAAWYHSRAREKILAAQGLSVARKAFSAAG